MTSDPIARAQSLCEHARRLLTAASDQWNDAIYENPDSNVRLDRESNAEENLSNALCSIACAAELSSLTALREELDRIRPQLEKEPLAMRFYADEPYLWWANHLWGVLNIIEQANALAVPAAKAPESAQDEVLQLAATIRRAESALVDRKAVGWVPVAEDDVHTRLEGILRASYPGLQSKAPIAGPARAHIPDTTIASVGTHIEYKYLSPKTKLSVIIDEMGADMNGFRDDRDFAIVFVVYETERFVENEAQLLEQLRKGGGSRVELVLLKGVPPNETDEKLKTDAKKKKPIFKDAVGDER
jgi:hypothetical protein